MIINAQIFQWGTPVKLNISKQKVHKIIKEYVDKNNKEQVHSYNQQLEDKKLAKIRQYEDVTFVNDNLMWQDSKVNIIDKLNIVELKVYCRKLELASKKDWRVPTYKELLTLVSYVTYNPSSINGIKNIVPDKYWSQTLKSNEKKKYWFVDFLEGSTNFESKMTRNHIRCVRDISMKKGEF